MRLPLGCPALQAELGVASDSVRCHAQPPPNGFLGPAWNLEAEPDEYACARMRRINGRGSQAGPSQTRRLHPPHLPTSSAWRRRCVRRGLPRVLSAGAAHWSLVLEAAAVVAEAPPSAPPPPRSAVAAAVRGLSSGPLRFPPFSAISPSASTSSGAAGNMRLRSRRPASD